VRARAFRETREAGSGSAPGIQVITAHGAHETPRNTLPTIVYSIDTSLRVPCVVVQPCAGAATFSLENDNVFTQATSQAAP
jgi:hypothetical protein